jgi:hypothetical protein
MGGGRWEAMGRWKAMGEGGGHGGRGEAMGGNWEQTKNEVGQIPKPKINM